MPIIGDSITTLSPIARADGVGGMTPNGTITRQFRATLSGVGSVIPSGQLLSPASATIAGTSDVSAVGRLNADANVFGEATLDGLGTLSATAVRELSAVATLTGTGTFSADSELLPAAAWSLPVVINLFVPLASGYSINEYAVRLKIGAVEQKIRRFRLQRPNATTGTLLEVELANPVNPRSLFGDSFTFELFTNGTWTTVLTGEIGTGSYSLAVTGDTTTLRSTAGENEALLRSFPNTRIYYNSATASVELDESDILRDDRGNVYVPDVLPIAGLSFGYLLREVADLCGFAGVQTNIPDFDVQTFRFEMGRAALAQVLELVQFIDPLVDVSGNKLRVLDVSNSLPGAAVSIPASRILQAEFQANPLAGLIDGAIVTYAERAGGDFYIQRFETNAVESGIYEGRPVRITDVNVWRDYYLVDSPFEVVRSALERTIKTTEALDTGAILGEETTVYRYDSDGVMVGSDRTVRALVPDAANGGMLTLKVVSSEAERLGYGWSGAGQKRLEWRTVERRELVARDEERLALEQPFLQPLVQAFENGNFELSMPVTEQVTSFVSERYSRAKGGLVAVNRTEVNHLLGTVTTSETKSEVGDNSIRGQRRGGQIIVYRDGVNPPADLSRMRLERYSIGEMPLRSALPIVRRKIKAAFEGKNEARFAISGFNLSLPVGSIVSLRNRDGSEVSRGVVVGWSIQGSLAGRFDLSQEFLIREI